MASNSTLSVLGCMILSAFLVSGCAKVPEPLQIQTTPIEAPELVLPTADILTTKPLEWTIITPDNLQQVFDDLKKSGQEPVIFGLTTEGYENLALNTNDIRTFMQQQNAIIVAYKRYYTQSQTALDGAVKIN